MLSSTLFVVFFMSLSPRAILERNYVHLVPKVEPVWGTWVKHFRFILLYTSSPSTTFDNSHCFSDENKAWFLHPVTFRKSRSEVSTTQKKDISTLKLSVGFYLDNCLRGKDVRGVKKMNINLDSRTLLPH